MDTKQIEYILKIAEENNITRAAEKLHVTQPALNQQLLRLERELGLPLFYRSRTNWRPTEAGEIYLENARKMLNIKQDTYRILGDMADRRKGTLSVGFTPGRGITMFSDVYPHFHRKFPEVTVEPRELSVKKQQALIAHGDLDLGFQTLCETQRTAADYILIRREELFLALPGGHPLAEGLSPQDYHNRELSVSSVQYEPFVLMYQESTIRQLVDGIFAQAGFRPQVLFETANTPTILSMIRNHLCCGIIPEHYIDPHDNGIIYFSLPSHPSWDLVISSRKGAYLSKAARYFIRLSTELWGN
ncbi:MAG: LysR family transcriptional regulator [Clostridiales bacterium]|nr:LysR family transcriptional regulator [Clostridiales bacterium]